MAEWVYEGGIGESRAALIEAGEIVEMRIEREGSGLRFGEVLAGRLRKKAGNGRAEVDTDNGSALLVSAPAGIAEGAALLVEVVREAIPERGNPKLPLVRISDAVASRPPPALLEEIGPARTVRAHEPDLFEQAGWSERLEQAQIGLVPFDGGLLRVTLTPAMTVIDVDGELAPVALAIHGAAASAAAIRRFDIGGSIGIDLPTVPNKAARLAAADALDAVLPQPFERTAVNGFGFLQVVRRRVRPSLLELMQSDPVRAEALALLRRLEREPLPGPNEVTAPSRVADLIARNPHWMAELAKRRGRPIAVEPQPASR